MKTKLTIKHSAISIAVVTAALPATVISLALRLFITVVLSLTVLTEAVVTTLSELTVQVARRMWHLAQWLERPLDWMAQHRQQ